MELSNVQAIVGHDRYRVHRLLGRGGMSTVWLADDLRDGRQVAIKMLNQELGDNPEFRQRFRNEASAARSVDSPNVVGIYNYREGTSGNHDACYIVMEYIRGESLSQVLRRLSTLPEHLVLDVLDQAAHGLSAIHAANLVHRDIKPGNLLVTPKGTVKITDFGIAKAAEAVPLTRTGMVVGTAQYVSPEQAQGKHVTPATDIYSLGCVAYEMVAGRRPFVGDTTVAVAVAHINEPPPALPPTVDPHIRELIGIMLRKDPNRRYADGRELANAVSYVRSGNRPPQPRGIQPVVYKQTDATHPMARELGEMTKYGAAPIRTGAQGTAASLSNSRPPVGARTSSGRAVSDNRRSAAPTRSAAKTGCGCGWIVLMVLVVLLVGAIFVVYSLVNNGSLPQIPGVSASSTAQSTEQAPSEQDSGNGWSSNGYGSQDNSGSNSGGYDTDGSYSGNTRGNGNSASNSGAGTKHSGSNSGNGSSHNPNSSNSSGNDSGNSGNTGSGSGGNNSGGNTSGSNNSGGNGADGANSTTGNSGNGGGTSSGNGAGSGLPNLPGIGGTGSGNGAASGTGAGNGSGTNSH